MVNRLRAGAGTAACGAWLAKMDTMERLALYSDLLFERMRNKLRVVEEILEQSGGNWNMTFFVMFFRTLGDASNREAFMRLARIVTCNTVLHERPDLKRLEALLLGSSGLLKVYPADDYIRSLESEFGYLSHKYRITPMSAGEWNLRRIKPMNHPVLRIAQAAAFFSQNEFMFRDSTACGKAADVESLFCVEASDYWDTHFTPGTDGSQIPTRIGRTKASLIGINLVAPMQFAYGQLTANEQIRERAMDLLESIEAEDNRYIRSWAAYGVVPANAFESQALLELSTCYCDPKRCEECPAGRRILRAFAGEQVCK